MNHSTTATATVTDPVCGMTIDPAKAVGSSSANGKTYYFCSRSCETKFDEAAPVASASCCAVERPGRPGRHSCC